MDDNQFFSKVCAMRKFQKQYFKTRDVQVLRQSKAVEKEIDDEIAARFAAKQTNIFDYENR